MKLNRYVEEVNLVSTVTERNVVVKVLVMLSVTVVVRKIVENIDWVEKIVSVMVPVSVKVTDNT